MIGTEEQNSSYQDEALKVSISFYFYGEVFSEKTDHFF